MLNHLASCVVLFLVGLTGRVIYHENAETIHAIADRVFIESDVAAMKLCPRLKTACADLWNSIKALAKTNAKEHDDDGARLQPLGQDDGAWSFVSRIFAGHLPDTSHQREKTNQMNNDKKSGTSMFDQLKEYVSGLLNQVIGDESATKLKMEEEKKQKEESAESLCDSADALYACFVDNLVYFWSTVVMGYPARVYENALAYFLLAIVTPILAGFFTASQRSKAAERKRSGFKLQMAAADGMLHDYFHEESRNTASFWEEEAWREREKQEQEEEIKDHAMEEIGQEARKEEGGESEEERVEFRTPLDNDDGIGDENDVDDDDEECESPDREPVLEGSASSDGVHRRVYPQLKVSPNPVLSTVFGRLSCVPTAEVRVAPEEEEMSASRRVVEEENGVDGKIGGDSGMQSAVIEEGAKGAAVEEEEEKEEGPGELEEEEEKEEEQELSEGELRDDDDDEAAAFEEGIEEESPVEGKTVSDDQIDDEMETASLTTVIAEEEKADKEQGEDLAPHDLAKDLTVIGPMGDSIDTRFTEDIITLAVVTSANCRKGGVETLI